MCVKTVFKYLSFEISEFVPENVLLHTQFLNFADIGGKFRGLIFEKQELCQFFTQMAIDFVFSVKSQQIFRFLGKLR